jgi:hypothetical protein
MTNTDFAIANYEINRISTMLSSAAKMSLGQGRTSLLIGSHTTLLWLLRTMSNESSSVTQIMDELDALNLCLHEQKEGSVGGPIHIITDDGNIDDSNVASCWKDTEGESDVVVRTICHEILCRLILITEPQRLVWWLRERIRKLGFDDEKLAVSVREGVIDPQTNGAYDARIKLGEEFIWIGLEQLEALHYG